MSVYITGGTLGFALGPLMFAPFAERFGMNWTPLLMIPGLVVVAFFLTRVPPVELPCTARGGFARCGPYAKPLGTALPVRRPAHDDVDRIRDLRSGDADAARDERRGGRGGGRVYLFASGVGGFFGGPAADRFGPERVIAWSLVASALPRRRATARTGVPFAVVLAAGGFFLQSTLPVNVVFGQALAPVSAATVSSLMMGFAWGTGGLTVPLTGWVADRIGIEPLWRCWRSCPLAAAARAALPLPDLECRPTASDDCRRTVVR